MSGSASERLISASTDEIEAVEDETESLSTPAKLKESHSSIVDIDGVDWLLTTILVTIDALLLELYRTGNTKWSTILTWFWEVNCDSSWSCSLGETMFLIFVAIINVFIVVPIVNINIRTPSRQSWRFWLLASWASLFLLDIIAVMQLIDSISKATDHDALDYPISHFWLVSTASILVIALNFRFLLLYGPFTFLTCDEEQTLHAYSGLRGVIGLEPSKMTKAYWLDVLRVRKIMNRSMYGEHRPDWTQKKAMTFKLVEDAKSRVNRFLNRRRLAKQRDTLRGIVLQDSIQHMATEDVDQYLAIVDSENKLMFKLGVLWQKIMTWKDMIAEEPGTFEYTSWMKAAIGFCLLMLIYNCIKAMEMIFALDSAWDLEHNVAVGLHEGLDRVHKTAVEIDAGIHSSAHELQTDIEQILEYISQFIPMNATDSDSYKNAASLMHLMLMTSSKLAKDSDFSRNKVVAAFFYADSLMRWLKYACLIGYPIGTFIGLYSIFQVMSQHKRMALSLEYEAEVRSNIVVSKMGEKNLEIKDTLMGMEEKYPIGGAVYFFGVLMSTAVIQQHVFGSIITLLCAIALNVRNIKVLLDFGGYIVLIYILIVTTNLFCSHVIGDRILTQDGYKIKHPWFFFLFLFAFTLVHAVLGFLYALWRALLLLITTIWVLNRLDISLFTTGKRLDNGHYSFMSMLLLSQIIHLEKKSKKNDEEQAAVSPLIRRMTMNSG
eukprot:g7074.t1